MASHATQAVWDESSLGGTPDQEREFVEAVILQKCPVPAMPVQIQYGTALVLMVFVLSMNLIATIIRSRARARRQW